MIPHFSTFLIIIRAAWDGDKKKAGIYLHFLISKLLEEGKEPEAKILIDFVEILEGKRKEVVFYPQGNIK